MDIELTPGQLRLRQHCADYLAAWGRPGRDQMETIQHARGLVETLQADPLVATDERTGQPLTAAAAHATYARRQHHRTPPARVVTRAVLDVDRHSYTRHDAREGSIAAGGGVKFPTTAYALLNYVDGAPTYRGEAGVTILRGSRLSLAADSQHRALAAFLWGGELAATNERIYLIDDIPSPLLREACTQLDRLCSERDGFSTDKLSDDQLYALAERASRAAEDGLTLAPCHLLDDLVTQLDTQPLAEPPRARQRRGWLRRR